MYLSNTIPSGDMLMLDMYNKYRKEDGFLYLTYGEMEKF